MIPSRRSTRPHRSSRLHNEVLEPSVSKNLVRGLFDMVAGRVSICERTSRPVSSSESTERMTDASLSVDHIDKPYGVCVVSHSSSTSASLPATPRSRLFKPGSIVPLLSVLIPHRPLSRTYVASCLAFFLVRRHPHLHAIRNRQCVLESLSLWDVEQETLLFVLGCGLVFTYSVRQEDGGLPSKRGTSTI